MALNEGKHTAEFLLSEGNGEISRDQIVVALAAAELAAGTVMGRITASGKYVQYSNAAVDGTQTAVGILFAKAPDSTADQKATLIARNAEVLGAELTGLDAAATIELAAIGIIVR